jgi:hypothetical protein
MAFLLEQRGEPYAFLDFDFLIWGGIPGSSALEERQLMQRNLAAVTGNYRQFGVGLFILAYFARDLAMVEAIREAPGMAMRVVLLAVPLAEIRRRAAGDSATQRQDDLRETAAAIASGEGTGLEDTVISNDQPAPAVAVAGQVMTWLGW